MTRLSRVDARVCSRGIATNAQVFVHPRELDWPKRRAVTDTGSLNATPPIDKSHDLLCLRLWPTAKAKCRFGTSARNAACECLWVRDIELASRPVGPLYRSDCGRMGS